MADDQPATALTHLAAEFEGRSSSWVGSLIASDDLPTLSRAAAAAWLRTAVRYEGDDFLTRPDSVLNRLSADLPPGDEASRVGRMVHWLRVSPLLKQIWQECRKYEGLLGDVMRLASDVVKTAATRDLYHLRHVQRCDTIGNLSNTVFHTPTTTEKETTMDQNYKGQQVPQSQPIVEVVTKVFGVDVKHYSEESILEAIAKCDAEIERIPEGLRTSSKALAKRVGELKRARQLLIDELDSRE